MTSSEPDQQFQTGASKRGSKKAKKIAERKGKTAKAIRKLKGKRSLDKENVANGADATNECNDWPAGGEKGEVSATLTVTEAATPVVTPVRGTTSDKEDEAHFGIAQNIFSTATGLWALGKTVPIITNFLGITEAVVGTVVDMLVPDLSATVDQDAVVLHLKSFDKDVVTPLVSAVLKTIEPAVSKCGEMLGLTKEVVFDHGKKEGKEEEESLSIAMCRLEKMMKEDNDVDSPMPPLVPMY